MCKGFWIKTTHMDVFKGRSKDKRKEFDNCLSVLFLPTFSPLTGHIHFISKPSYFIASGYSIKKFTFTP